MPRAGYCLCWKIGAERFPGITCITRADAKPRPHLACWSRPCDIESNAVRTATARVPDLTRDVKQHQSCHPGNATKGQVIYLFCMLKIQNQVVGFVELNQLQCIHRNGGCNGNPNTEPRGAPARVTIRAIGAGPAALPAACNGRDPARQTFLAGCAWLFRDRKSVV